MSKPEHPRLTYEFGSFRLDVAEYSLTRKGRPISLQPKVFELLVILLQQQGHTIEKERLMRALWPDVSVEESSLTQLICQLRKSLGETAAAQQYIETIPKRGYRFVAEVTTSPHQAVSDLIITSRSSTRVIIDHEEEIDKEPNSENDPLANTKEISRPSRRNLKTFAFNSSSLSLGVVGVAAVGIAFLLLSQGQWLPDRGLNKERLPFQNADPRKLTASGKAILPALSPDGKTVAYVVDALGRQEIWVRQIATTSRVQITKPAERSIFGLTFSLDGQTLYFVEKDKGQISGGLYQIPVFGGTPRKLLSDVNSPITFSPDGKRFAFIRGNLLGADTALMIANADGSQVEALLVRNSPNYFAGVAWSPDGTKIAAGVETSDAHHSYRQVMIVNVSDGKETPLGEQWWAEIGEIAWLRDGSGILVNALQRDSRVFAFQLWHLSYPSGKAQKLFREFGNYEGVSIASQSEVIALGRSSRVSKISIEPSDGSSIASEILSSMSDNYSESFGLSWTSGGKIVYSSHGSGNSDIWIMNADGRNQKQLTFDSEREFWPVVSPDDRYIVFSTQGPNGVHICRIDIDGSNRKQLTYGKGEHFPSFSADGKSVFFSSMEPGWPAVGRVSIDGGEIALLTQARSARPVVSPDGKTVACLYFDNALSRMTVALIPVAGGEPIKTFRDLPLPYWSLLQWTPDGKGLAYIATMDGVSNIWVQPIAGGPPKQVTRFTQDLIYRFAWSRDGKHIAVDRGTDVKDIFLLAES